MAKNQIMTFEAAATAIEEGTVDGHEVYKVHARTLPFNCVMSGVLDEGRKILFPAAEIEKAAHTFEGVDVPYGHPVTKEGRHISASSPLGRVGFGCFGHCANVRAEADSEGREGLSMDMIFFKKRMQESEIGRKVESMLKNMQETNTPIQTSIGASYDEIDAPPGMPYDRVAVNIRGDHNAIVRTAIGERAAHTPGQGTGMGVYEGVRVFSMADASFPDLNEGAGEGEDPQEAGALQTILNRIEMFIMRRSDMDKTEDKGAEAPEAKGADIAVYEDRLSKVEGAVSEEALKGAFSKVLDEALAPIRENQEIMVKEIKEKNEAERLGAFEAVVEAGMLSKEVAENTPTEALKVMAAGITKGEADEISKSSGDAGADEDPLAGFDAKPADEASDKETS